MYPAPLNVTSFESALAYSREIVRTGSGLDLFGPMLMVAIFFGAYAVASRFTQERAFLFASTISVFSGFLLTSAGFITVDLFGLMIVVFLAALFFSSRVVQ